MILRTALWLIFGMALIACGAAPEEAIAEVPTASAPQTVQLLSGPDFLAAYAKTEDAYLIDCRTPGEQAGGMLEGAVPMDYQAPGFRESVKQLERGRPVFVYCASGGRSGQAAEVMAEVGFARVVDLEGGYRSLKR